MATVHTLSNIALAVPDLDEAEDFYRDRWGIDLRCR